MHNMFILDPEYAATMTGMLLERRDRQKYEGNLTSGVLTPYYGVMHPVCVL